MKIFAGSVVGVDNIFVAILRRWLIPFLLLLGITIYWILSVSVVNPVEVTITFSSTGDWFMVPDATFLAHKFVNLMLFLLHILAILSIYMVATKRKLLKVSLYFYWIIFFLGIFVTLIASASKSNSISFVNLLVGSVVLAVPLVFGAMSGVLCERSGVVNIAIEGQLLGGAFSAAIFGSLFQSSYAGLFAAALSGMFVSYLLAIFSIRYFVNQIILGVVINVLIASLTGFLFSAVLKTDPERFNSPPGLHAIDLPVLSGIPVLGSIFFKHSIIVYIMFLLVIFLYFGLYRTRWGLRLRASGELPEAADMVGLSVPRIRFWNVILGGAAAGLGGAYFTLDAAGSFTQNMTGGRGYIALAALILGRWNPLGAFFAALLFGFSDNLQSIFAIMGVPIPSQILHMLPYLVTVVALVGVVGNSRAPAALGVPYRKS